MTVSEAIDRLTSMMHDRERLMTGDIEADESMLRDIEALNFAIEIIESASVYLRERPEKRNDDRSD